MSSSLNKFCTKCRCKVSGNFCEKCGSKAEESKSPSPSPLSPDRRVVAPSSSSGKPKPKFGGGSKCVRCKTTVYEAEKKLGPKGLEYHQKCFSCVKCKKPLTSELGDHNGEIYCLLCHQNTYY
jgi:hypothetical protein